MTKGISRILWGAGLAVSTATAAQAQNGTCDGAVAPLTSNRWSVVYQQFSNVVNMSGVQTFIPATGATLANAVCQLDGNIPSPPWQPNSAASRWLGVNNTGSIGAFGGDDIMRFQYEYTVDVTTFFTGGNRGLIGWDNNLLGVRWNSSLAAAQAGFGTGGLNNSVLGSSPNFNNDGFCRADGEFSAASFPNCLASFDLGATPAGNNWLTIVMVGDGRTDGLNIRSAAVVPEPSTYALMAAGLLGMAVVARRRRAV